MKYSMMSFAAKCLRKMSRDRYAETCIGYEWQIMLVGLGVVILGRKRRAISDLRLTILDCRWFGFAHHKFTIDKERLPPLRFAQGFG